MGYAEASGLLGFGGGTFAGQSVDGNAVLVRCTWAGDANLDGRVDVVDLGILAGHWQNAVAGSAQGDSNYDGVADVIDLGLLAGNWQTGGGSAAG